MLHLGEVWVPTCRREAKSLSQHPDSKSSLGVVPKAAPKNESLVLLPEFMDFSHFWGWGHFSGMAKKLGTAFLYVYPLNLSLAHNGGSPLSSGQTAPKEREAPRSPSKRISRLQRGCPSKRILKGALYVR